MKKLLIASFMLFGLANLSAQKNTLLVGGDVSISRSKTSNDIIDRTVGISPYVGYQFSDHWTLGAKSKISDNQYNEKSANTYTHTYNYKIGGFLRYTQPLSNIFSIYGDLGGGYVRNAVNIKDKDNNDLGKSREHGWYVDLTPALFINFKNSFGINFSVGSVEYSQNNSGGGTQEDKSFKFNIGKSINIGISKNFAL